jgi:serine/threonine-protein kinase RsbW
MLTTTLYSRVFHGAPDQISHVRAQVGAYLEHCPARDDVVLVVSELAANAVLHSLSEGGTITVRVERHGTWVRAEVQDAGGAWGTPEPDGRPHGLDLVSLLARTWGVTSLPAGRAVWARIEI